jgi:membrane-associated phospholipid phosphatase
MTTSSTLKSHFAFERPYAALEKTEVRRLEFRNEDEANRSFPSGHVFIITALIASLWPALNSGFRWFGAGIILAVAWSRIALGVHFPADVLASITICTIEIVLVRWLLYGFLRRMFGIIL